MNTNTQKVLQQLKFSAGVYQEAKEHIYHEKVYNEVLEMLSAVFSDYQADFNKSIEYISETRRHQEAKRLEIESLSSKIRVAIKAYYMINPMDLEDNELDCLSQSVVQYQVDDLKNHFKTLNMMFVPLKGALLNIGISSSMLKDLEAKIQELDIALPFNFQEIETKVEKFNMALKAINLLEKLDIEYSQNKQEELKVDLAL